MDWTFRLRDRRLRRWVTYIPAVFAYPPHSASLPRSLRSRLAYPRYALSARHRRAYLPPHGAIPAATLRASVQDFNQPQLRLYLPTSKSLVSLKENKWGLSMRCTSYVCVYIWGFQYGVPLPSTFVYIWGLSMRSSFLSESIISAQHWGSPA